MNHENKTSVLIALDTFFSKGVTRVAPKYGIDVAILIALACVLPLSVMGVLGGRMALPVGDQLPAAFGLRLVAAGPGRHTVRAAASRLTRNR